VSVAPPPFSSAVNRKARPVSRPSPGLARTNRPVELDLKHPDWQRLRDVRQDDLRGLGLDINRGKKLSDAATVTGSGRLHAVDEGNTSTVG
jgi:hypothetical protein